MNKFKILVICIGSVFFLFGCSSNPKKEEGAGLKTPNKEIIVYEGDINRQYTTIGPVEYTLVNGIGYGSTLDVPIQSQTILKDMLKKVAFTKYGEKVDAIINTKMGKGIEGGFFGTIGAGYGAENTIVSGNGVAVSYKNTDTKETIQDNTTLPVQPKNNKKRKNKVN